MYGGGRGSTARLWVPCWRTLFSLYCSTLDIFSIDGCTAGDSHEYRCSVSGKVHSKVLRRVVIVNLKRCHGRLPVLGR